MTLFELIGLALIPFSLGFGIASLLFVSMLRESARNMDDALELIRELQGPATPPDP